MSILKMARLLGLTDAMKHEIVLEKEIKNGKRKCWVDGVEYDSMISMYRAFGVSESVVYRFRYHHNNPNCSQELAISMAIDHMDEYRAKKKARADRYKKEYESYCLKKKQAEFLFDGITYPDFKSCVQSLASEFNINLDRNSIKQQAKKNGYSLVEQLTLSVHRANMHKKRREQKFGSVK